MLCMTRFAEATVYSVYDADPSIANTHDWAYEKLNVIHAYCLELRGPGFSAGPEYIEMSYNEVWVGLNTMLNIIHN